MKNSYFLLFIFLFLASCSTSNDNEQGQWIAYAPAGSEYVRIDKNGKTILPNGRFITPLGKQITTAPHPYGLILSPDGNIAVTANSGTSPFSITVIKNLLSENPIVQQIPEGAKTDEGILEAVFMGLAISPDNQTLYVAGGETNKVFIFDLNTNQKKGEINCAMKIENEDFTHGYLGDMILSKDGKTLYIVDQINFRLIIIDTEKQTLIANVPTGRYPFGIALSPDEKQAYVANVGVFEYKFLKDVDLKDLKNTSRPYASTGYNTKEMREGNDSLGIPPLGDPNAPEAFSIWAIDLAKKETTAKIKTGYLVGQKVEDFPTVGGSSPNSVVATDKYVFVSNGNNDCISVIDIKTNKVVKDIFLVLDERLGNLRGVIPFGLALSPDNKRLYVAEAGINAVGVIDVESLKLLGHLPVGWFPSKLKVSNDGKKLIVANAKGYGSGPNGGKDFQAGAEGSYIGALMKGTVSIFTIPQDIELENFTKQVVENNFKFEKITNPSEQAKKPTLNPIPLYSKYSESPIKYIVFISKENRTYDEVFAQNTNGKGDTTLARFGLNRTFANRKGDLKLSGVDVMPNHHALAKRFAMSDNFYCDSDVSADGHRWLVGTYPNEWVETSTAAAYGGKRSMRIDSKAKGNLAFVGAAGAIFPEDYNEAGSIWEHLDRNKIDFFNFGFGVEMGSALYSDSTLKYGGVKYIVNYPLPEPLFAKTSKIYPTYNMAIPDQFRVDIFKKEFEEKWLSTNKPLPQVLTIIIPNDHGARERPHAGFPFLESYMADNDLAIGRIVEYLSNTPYWKNMAIIITEDDPQGGRDHIDAHRSILMVISPYTKKNYVSHIHYSFGSIFKTFWHILGLPYLNQYDAGATDMSDMFTSEPDFTPYKALPIDKCLFDPQKALDPFNEKFDWKAFEESEEMDKVEDMQRRSKEEEQLSVPKNQEKKKQ
ncbi:beta-propeller fold lactonase family protein [Thermoflexibacter ruber]|uniref:40-residue YVTN family beta-propeller repeat-containing protein n=1 Tax=Thermoflexibacter ruber TaxID=1003 RepID=A0A1I2EVE9_9BACT|nr:beta-propeller fold lactonase family protein [Thermoflexibacter ruber]SFE96456.1 40-residue YVTN family beta-propeller repeat-containing protein [Thermoflexibacter ruber]